MFCYHLSGPSQTGLLMLQSFSSQPSWDAQKWKKRVSINLACRCILFMIPGGLFFRHSQSQQNPTALCRPYRRNPPGWCEKMLPLPKKQPVDTICDCGISNRLQNVDRWLVSNPITDGLYQWKPFTSPRFSIHFPSFTRVHQQVSYGCKHSGSSCNSVAKFLATLGPPIGAPTQPARTWAWHDHGWVFDPFKGWCNAPGPGFPLLP